MPLPSTPYDKTEPLDPVGTLTDFVLYRKLSNLSAAWWAVAEATNARRGRVALDRDGTELPVDWVEYDHASKTGLIRIKIPGNFSNKSDNTIRIYPPVAANSIAASNSTYGSEAVYPGTAAGYYPLNDSLVDRTGNAGEMSSVLGGGSLTYEAGRLGQGLRSAGGAHAAYTAGGPYAGFPLSVMFWAKIDVGGSGTHLVGMNDLVDLDAGHTLYMRNSGLSNIAVKYDDGSGSEVGADIIGGLVRGSWQHYAMTLSSGFITSYFNGSQASSLGHGRAAPSLDRLSIGGDNTMEAVFDEVWYFQDELSADWIDYEHGQTATPDSYWSAAVHVGTGSPSGGSSTPLNLNLDKIVLPTREATELTKVLVVHDSQGLRQSNRWVGQVGKWDMQHVGMMCYSVNQSGVGPYFLAETTVPGATITHTRMNPGDNWGDGNTSDHAMWGSKITITGTISPNFQPLVRFGINNAGFVNAYPVDNRHHARVITRDISGNFSRYRLSEFRGTTEGNSDDFGNGAFDPVNFDFDGSLKIANWGIRDEGPLGNPGEIVGTIIRDSNASDTNRDLHVLGALIYSSPSAENFESTGLVLANTGYSGWSCYDHINRQSLQTKEAMVEVAEGYDTVIIMMGHNAEDLGDFDANLTSLISIWKSAHTNKGYAEPDFLLIAPWAATGTNMTVEKKNLTRAVALAGGYGFISLWDSYGEASPDGRTERLDGTTVTAYAMDPIHPSDATTAEHIAKDIEWHFDPANFNTTSTGVFPLTRHKGVLPIAMVTGITAESATNMVR